MTVSEVVLNQMNKNKMGKSELADLIGMPLSTLSTKFAKNTFTAEELIKIANLLNLNLSSFEPKADGTINLTFKDKTNKVYGVDKKTFSREWICPFQLKNDNGEGIYILSATAEGDSVQLLSIEDFNIRNELVLRSRGIEKIYQFIDIAGFDIIENEDISLGELMEGLFKKRGIKTQFARYMRDMANRWLDEIK